MADRPYTVLSACMSLDGYLDSATGDRLVLSNGSDLDRVDSVRASCDAILVGAATVRNDDPRLVVRDTRRREQRVAVGRPPSPTKVTVTCGGRLDARARFFTVGDAEKIVYASGSALPEARARLGSVATVVDTGGDGPGVSMRRLSEDLFARGVRQLLVEGGGRVHTQFLAQDLADELHLVVAPFFVGDSRAVRFVADGEFPFHPGRRATLAQVRQIGDVVLLQYALSPRYRRFSGGNGRG